jgi:hypothetical protein
MAGWNLFTPCFQGQQSARTDDLEEYRKFVNSVKRITYQTIKVVEEGDLTAVLDVSTIRYEMQVGAMRSYPRIRFYLERASPSEGWLVAGVDNGTQPITACVSP